MSNNLKNQTTQELLAQQRQQFENYQKEQASKTKKRWLWGCGGCLIVFIILSIILLGFVGAFFYKGNKEIEKLNATNQVTTAKQPHDSHANTGQNNSSTEQNNASTEQNNALKKAKIYSDNFYMSKKGIYDILTSDYGDKFPADVAQYAIDHLQADYKKNALKKAESYFKDQNMSKNEIYDQLVSQYGEMFTEEEAQYAIEHLE
ncbi:Ltp family lipoprotein [Staphylococcus americanisciuri]|uniref:Ltp family lipoprotein n=1 Tax=Staphylococcus americanisciuri TaxID=2973940 RepID=A0ABT2EYB6_9STAP|nr:Ltp family lipoprotein [Staphylococcus americanisciuri]MCS4485275.1 Ltp family lipoprotein [Staphylococcus americanisciuri]